MPTRTGEPTAAELVTLLRRREVSARELAERHLERLERADEALNAVTYSAGAAALTAADAADRALATGEPGDLLGLPLTVKDSIAVAGLPWESGSVARKGIVASEDATLVARLRRAGAVVLAKTATPEYTWSYETNCVAGGRTVNPYAADRTSGGSSGGEAALLAVDATPVGLGTDGLGSVRVPSHYCGTFGLRPTAGRLPETGVWPTTRDTGMLDMSTPGPMARSVDDLALLLGVLSGADGIDPFAHDSPLRDHRGVDVASLRVGVYADDGVGGATPATREAVARAAAALGAAGAEVEEAKPPPLDDVTDVAFRMMAADGGAQARADLEPAGGRHVPQVTWLLENLAEFELSAAGFFELMRRWIELRAALRRFVGAYDVVVCPTVAGPAPLHERRPGDDGELEDYTAFSYVQAYSVAGLPVVVAPAGAERGLPIGVQVVAPYAREDLALAAAAVLERELAGELPSPQRP
jgi:Asp-tRNA(Asn)/Glu-tRNA(Gln) amidotransferase A subunit family amidase